MLAVGSAVAELRLYDMASDQTRKFRAMSEIIGGENTGAVNWNGAVAVTKVTQAEIVNQSCFAVLIELPTGRFTLKVLLPQSEHHLRTHGEYGLFHGEQVIFHRG